MGAETKTVGLLALIGLLLATGAWADEKASYEIAPELLVLAAGAAARVAALETAAAVFASNADNAWLKAR